MLLVRPDTAVDYGDANAVTCHSLPVQIVGARKARNISPFRPGIAVTLVRVLRIQRKIDRTPFFEKQPYFVAVFVRHGSVEFDPDLHRRAAADRYPVGDRLPIRIVITVIVFAGTKQELDGIETGGSAVDPAKPNVAPIKLNLAQCAAAFGPHHHHALEMQGS